MRWQCLSTWHAFFSEILRDVRSTGAHFFNPAASLVYINLFRGSWGNFRPLFVSKLKALNPKANELRIPELQLRQGLELV